MPTDAFRFARTQVLLAAHACGVLAIETLHPDYNDHKGLKAAARDARADGYTGMFAIHPVQVAEINATFSATEEELEAARKVVEEFEIGQLPEELAFDRRIAGTRQLVLARRVLGLDEPRERDAMRGPILRPA
jgi:citrate lyase subunit beta/citryl-CoA lyase